MGEVVRREMRRSVEEEYEEEKRKEKEEEVAYIDRCSGACTCLPTERNKH